MINIQSISFNYSEINRESTNLGFSRTKVVNSMEEYTIGKNKNLYQINIRNQLPIYKISLELYLDYDKFKLLNTLFQEQQSERLNNYSIGDSITETILYTYNNPTSQKNYCFLELMELIDVVYILDSIKYIVKLDIIEI